MGAASRAVVGALLLLAACVTAEPRVSDYARLEGEWEVTYSEAYGEPLYEGIGAVFLFRGDRVKRSTDAGDERFALDESVTPKRIDFHDPPKADVLGIYRLDGDVLVICTNGADRIRPSEFRTGLFSAGAILTRFERRKPE